MDEALSELMTAVLGLTAGWEAVFLVFARVAALTSLLPVFGERSVPMRVKLGLAIAFTVIVSPAVIGDPVEFGPAAIGAELLAGLLFGMGLRLFVLALQTAGSIAAQATSLSQLLGGNAADPMPAMGHILMVGALALAVMSGLHVKAAQFMLLTYDLIPMATPAEASVFGDWGRAQVAQAFTLAFSLAAPFLILGVLYNLTLGAINRAMPQLMVAFVGAPLITAGGLIVFCLAAPVMLTTWLAALDHFLAAPTGGPR